MENELDSRSMQEGGHASIIEKLQSASTVTDEIDGEPTRQKIPGVHRIQTP